MVVAFLRILFRSEDLASAGRYVEALFTNPLVAANEFSQTGLVCLAAAIILHYVPQAVNQRMMASFFRMPAMARAMTLAFVAYMVIPFGSGDAPFIYFQF